MELNNANAANFIAWCFKDNKHTGNDVSKALTAARSLLINNGGDWARTPYLSRVIKGYIKLKPSKPQHKRPFCNIHLLLTWKHYINLKDFNHLSIGLGVLFGYHGGLRPTEYAYKKGSIMLRMHQMEFISNRSHPKEVQITINQSKTNQQNTREELILLPCRCHDPYVGVRVPCAVHHLLKYLEIRTKLFGEPKNTDPILINKAGNPLSYNYVHNFLHNAITSINNNSHVKLNPKHYTPHALRAGGCTDLARSGAPDWRIEKYGRWTTRMWKDIYVCLNLIDVAKLLGVTITSLLDSIVRPMNK